eukprot:GFUD01072199.1.p1 GENE.GFUD01072199.1~~GFUD01072199.1.p1  ORF type:complete len:342 (-),score=75.17 GFUD01072199.1:69-995(-)
MCPYPLLMLVISLSQAEATPHLQAHEIEQIRRQMADLRAQNILLIRLIRNLSEVTNLNFKDFEKNSFMNLKSTNDVERENNENLALRVNSEFYQLRKQAENILTNRLSICAFTDIYRGFGKVLYDYLLTNQPAWVMGREYQAADVLNPSSGEFEAPVGGMYQVSASVIVDTWEDDGPRHAMFQFVSGRNEEKHEALLYADLGPSKSSDLVQVSRTVFLPLEQGDVLYMEQVEVEGGQSQATTVKKVTFCVLLINLETVPSFQRSFSPLPSFQTTNLTPYHFKTVDKHWIDEIQDKIESPTVKPTPNTP